MTATEERNWAVLCHLAALAVLIIPLGNVIGPLVVWLMKRSQSDFVDGQGKMSLNFQLSMTLYGVISAVLMLVLVGVFLMIAIGIVDLVFVIIAAVKVSQSREYRYPLAIRFLR